MGFLWVITFLFCFCGFLRFDFFDRKNKVQNKKHNLEKGVRNHFHHCAFSDCQKPNGNRCNEENGENRKSVESFEFFSVPHQKDENGKGNAGNVKTRCNPMNNALRIP